MTWHPPEILLHLGSLSIRTYGVVIALAILTGFAWADRRRARFGLDQTLVNDVLFWSVVGALIGARLAFVLQNSHYFRLHPALILAIWTGGLSFHGGLVGAILVGTFLLARKDKLYLFWQLADVASAPILFGAILGRLGNWANQELYGYPTNQPWAITIDATHRLPGFEQFSTFHPTFAYEMLLNGLGLAILLLVIEGKRRRSLPVGTSFLFVIAWYGLARGLTEIWRIGDRLVGPLSLAQLISLGMIVGALLIWQKRKRAATTAQQESVK